MKRELALWKPFCHSQKLLLTRVTNAFGGYEDERGK